MHPFFKSRLWFWDSFILSVLSYYFKFPNKFYQSKVLKIFSAQIDNLLNFSLWSLIRIPVKLCKNWSQRSPALRKENTRFQEQKSLKTFTIRKKMLCPSNFQSNINRKSWQLISIREHPSCPLWGFLMKLASILKCGTIFANCIFSSSLIRLECFFSTIHWSYHYRFLWSLESEIPM